MRKLTTSEIRKERRNPGVTRIYNVLARFQVAAADKGEVKSMLEEFAQSYGNAKLIEVQVDDISPSLVRRRTTTGD
jgi:hypothetical protein